MQGRKANPVQQPVEVSFKEERFDELDANGTAAAAMLQANDEIFAAGQDIGRLEAMDFVVTVTTSAILAVYENVKKSKAWRHLRNPKSGHGDHFQSLEEFCEVKLGRSHERLRKIVANRNLIGQEAFEQAERIGLRQVDYNAIKALPAPKQALMQEALAEGASLETVTRALRELAAQDQREIEQLAKERDELKAEAAATGEVLAKKNERIDRLEREKKLLARLPPDERLRKLQAEATTVMNDALGCIRGGLRAALDALSQNGSEPDVQVYSAGLVGQLAAELAELRRQFNLPDVSNARDQELMAKVDQWAGPLRAQQAARAAEAAQAGAAQ